MARFNLLKRFKKTERSNKMQILEYGSGTVEYDENLWEVIDLPEGVGSPECNKSLRYVGQIVDGQIIGSVPNVPIKYEMFKDCTDLVEPPVLEGSIIIDCFVGCSALNPSVETIIKMNKVNAPAGIFKGCGSESVMEVPALPFFRIATTVTRSQNVNRVMSFNDLAAEIARHKENIIECTVKGDAGQLIIVGNKRPEISMEQVCDVQGIQIWGTETDTNDFSGIYWIDVTSIIGKPEEAEETEAAEVEATEETEAVEIEMAEEVEESTGDFEFEWNDNSGMTMEEPEPESEPEEPEEEQEEELEEPEEEPVEESEEPESEEEPEPESDMAEDSIVMDDIESPDVTIDGVETKDEEAEGLPVVLADPNAFKSPIKPTEDHSDEDVLAELEQIGASLIKQPEATTNTDSIGWKTFTGEEEEEEGSRVEEEPKEVEEPDEETEHINEETESNATEPEEPEVKPETEKEANEAQKIPVVIRREPEVKEEKPEVPKEIPIKITEEQKVFQKEEELPDMVYKKLESGEYSESVVLTDNGTLEIFGDVVISADCPIEATGRIRIVGDGTLTLVNRVMFPCIGPKTDVNKHFGFWNLGVEGHLESIYIEGVSVRCKTQTPNFSLGSYGLSNDVKISYGKDGNITCPETTGKSVIASDVKSMRNQLPARYVLE